MIVKTEAIVLASMKFRETSRIVRLYTRKFGKLSALAKGARDPKNKFGPSLQPMNHVVAVLYKKEHRDLHLLTQCDVARHFKHLAEDVHRMAPAMVILELVDKIAHSEEENPSLFALLVGTLESIDNATKNAGNALYFFEMKLCDILGIRPNLTTCLHCSSAITEQSMRKAGVSVQLSAGGVYCAECSSAKAHSGSLSRSALNVLRRLQESRSADAIMNISLADSQKLEIGETLRLYLRHHIEGLRALKSEQVFASITHV